MADDGARSGPGTESGTLQRTYQRLVLRNDRFDKLLSLPPDALVPGVSYAEILRQGVSEDSVP